MINILLFIISVVMSVFLILIVTFKSFFIHISLWVLSNIAMIFLSVPYIDSRGDPVKRTIHYILLLWNFFMGFFCFYCEFLIIKGTHKFYLGRRYDNNLNILSQQTGRSPLQLLEIVYH